MNYISAPIKLIPTESRLSLSRPYDDPVAMMDNLVEMIVLTPKGTFNADPDFGFEYWDPIYADVSPLQYNVGSDNDGYSRQYVKDKCEAGIVECIINYAPLCLKVSDVFVEMSLKNNMVKLMGPRKVYSHREVSVTVTAKIDDGIGTLRDYYREITFMMEPVFRRSMR